MLLPLQDPYIHVQISAKCYKHFPGVETKTPALENLYPGAVTAGDNEPCKHINKIMSDSDAYPVSEVTKSVNVQNVARLRNRYKSARGASERGQSPVAIYPCGWVFFSFFFFYGERIYKRAVSLYPSFTQYPSFPFSINTNLSCSPEYRLHLSASRFHS